MSYGMSSFFANCTGTPKTLEYDSSESSLSFSVPPMKTAATMSICSKLFKTSIDSWVTGR